MKEFRLKVQEREDSRKSPNHYFHAIKHLNFLFPKNLKFQIKISQAATTFHHFKNETLLIPRPKYCTEVGVQQIWLLSCMKIVSRKGLVMVHGQHWLFLAF